ncbi:unnamed protein product [Leuciscus chuanchicus]
MRYLVRFQTGSSVETTDDDKKGKRKRISNSKYRPQASSDEEESSLPDAPAELSFRQPLFSFENIVPGNKVSVLPDAPEVASILENQENVEPSVDFRAEPGFSPEIQTPLHRAKSLSTRHLTGYSPHQFLDEKCRAFTPPAANLPWQRMAENAGGESHSSVIGPWTPLASRVQHEVFSYEGVFYIYFFYVDFQRLQNEKQAVMDENQALREENQALRESNARAASDDSGSLQEQVKQVGTMLKTFACTGQSEFGDVVRSMDNKMDTMLQHFSANVSVGELSLPGDLLLPLDTQEELALLDNSLRQDKELQEQFLSLRFLANLKTIVWRMLQSIFSNHLSINTTWTRVGDKACFRDMFLKTIVQRSIRKNPATQDATDEAIQVNVTRYLKGASNHEGGKRRCFNPLNLG